MSLRNFAAHGKVKEISELGDLTGDWGTTVRELIASTDLYFDLEKILQGKDSVHDPA